MQPSNELFSQLRDRIPGGVNSPFRAFDEVGGEPPVLVRGEGPRVFDSQGRAYLDYCCAWGPVLLGHAHPALQKAAQAAFADGSVLGAPTPYELRVAELLHQAYPSMEQLRLVNSGAEAVASALRVARGFTRRPRILKFEGCYHGHVECLDAAGAEADALGGPLALGASPGAAGETLVACFNDLASVTALLEGHRDQVAAVILEPVTGSMGVIRADDDFLVGLRAACDQHGCLLIFDEVLSGFRVAYGGAQESTPVVPDLTCLGKAAGGGHPIGVFGGSRRVMQTLAPVGTVYQAGTFCGNPVTARCAVAFMEEVYQPGTYAYLNQQTEWLCRGLQQLSSQCVVQWAGGMFSLGFGPGPLRDHRDVARLDRERFAQVFHALLKRGIYLPPSTVDAASLTLAHGEDDLKHTLAMCAEAFRECGL